VLDYNIYFRRNEVIESMSELEADGSLELSLPKSEATGELKIHNFCFLILFVLSFTGCFKSVVTHSDQP